MLKHGGPRTPGPGKRLGKPPVVSGEIQARRNITLSDTVFEGLALIGGGSASEGIRRCYSAYIAAHRPARIVVRRDGGSVWEIEPPHPGTDQWDVLRDGVIIGWAGNERAARKIAQDDAT